MKMEDRLGDMLTGQFRSVTSRREGEVGPSERSRDRTMSSRVERGLLEPEPPPWRVFPRQSRARMGQCTLDYRPS